MVHKRSEMVWFGSNKSNRVGQMVMNRADQRPDPGPNIEHGAPQCRRGGRKEIRLQRHGERRRWPEKVGGGTAIMSAETATWTAVWGGRNRG